MHCIRLAGSTGGICNGNVMMKKDKNQKLLSFISNYLEIIGTLFILFVIILFLWFKERKVNNSGVITIAKVIDLNMSGDGSDLSIEIYFHKKVYKTSLNIICTGNCVGKYYFIKVNKDDPTDYPIFYEEKEVPQCILLNYSDQSNGWIDFPLCK
jgi:hypothetical protein